MSSPLPIPPINNQVSGSAQTTPNVGIYSTKSQISPSPIPGNISSLANPQTLNNLKQSQNPKSFGDQLKNQVAQQTVQALSESTLAKLIKEKTNLIQEEISLDINHQTTLQKLKQENTPSKKIVNGQTVDSPPQLSNEEYQKAVATEEVNYEAEKEIIKKKKQKNQEDLDKFLKDPFKKQKDELKKRQENRKKAQSRNQAERNRARKEKANAVLKNAKKSLVPILTLLISNKIAELISQNRKIKKLVDDTNAIIIDANTSGNPVKLNNAKIARDNAIKIIQDNEAKITKIRDQINRISTYITIFSLIINIISAIPIPTSVPPGVGIPVNLIIKLVKILDKANRILLTLSALIPILISSLDKAISILQDLKAQLLNINGQLDIALLSDTPGTSDLSNNTNLDSNTNLDNGSFPTGYKGFKFALKEGKLNVRGFKQRYAVAIDTNNVEVLKSELSFTLDPNDLIDQLKIIIDRENLIA
jgi:hypothetical protein